MREIKCRAKRIDNGEWVYGSPLIDYVTGKFFIHALGNSVNDSDKVGEEGILNFVAFEVIRETVSQYTGLKDKNGKEIYGGDIVRVFQPFNVPTKAIVEFNDGCFELKGIELTWRDYVKCFVVNHAIEIIGNIHENKGLLENR